MKGIKPQTDVVLKEYWRNNEQFADLFNALLFSGQDVISPSELEERDTDESLVYKGDRMEESIKRSRDIIKISKSSAEHEVNLALFGIENQMKIHYAMPLRVMEYDCFAYKKQYRQTVGLHKRQKDLKEKSAEFLSQMKKEDRLLLVDVRQNSLCLKNDNNRNLFQLLKFALDEQKPLKYRKAEILRYCDEHEVSGTVLETVGSITGSHADYRRLKKKEELNMRTIFEEEREEGRVEGREEGREEARQEAIKSMLEFGIPEEKILLKYSKEELDKVLKLANHAGMLSV